MLAEVRAIGECWQRCNRNRKHRSGEGIAATCVYRKHPVETSRSDVKESKDNYSSRWGNPHLGPVLAKLLKITRGKREPTQARARDGGCQPIQTDTHGGGSTKK